MNRSAGVLVVALERIAIETGCDRRGAPDQEAISNETIATPWNQIEAAFAYVQRRPLLVIRETGVRADGLLEGRYDWYVHETDLDPNFVRSTEFNGTFESWLRDVRQKAGWRLSYRR